MAKNKGNFKGKGRQKGKNPKSKGFKKKKGYEKVKFDTNARLVVRNLSFKTTVVDLRKHFEPYGKILNVKLPKRENGDLVGCAFVQYESVDNAKLGFNNRNGQPFLGRTLSVDWAVSKDEYIKQLNYKENIKEETVEDEIKNEPEAIEERRVNKKASKRQREDFDKNKTIKRNHESTNDESEDLKKDKIIRKARLIVRNIPFKATEETLKSHFEPYGEVVESILLKKPSGDLVGCGFIQFKNVQSATKAMMATNSKPFLGREIFVDWAVPKFKYMSYVTQKQDEEEHLKNEVKSEPESDEEETIVDVADVRVKSESENGSDAEEKDDEDDDDSENEVEEEEDDVKITENVNKRVSANDAEDGKTVFLRNVPFSAANEDIEEFAKKFGEIQYALVCVDKLTEHSKGTAFIRFKNKEDAEICSSAGSERLNILGQTVEALPALFRDKAKDKNKKPNKDPKDSRNLYLIKEGLILANTKAAVGVSTTDMSKRLALEQRKSEMLKNLNRFISRYRLTIHNIPLHYTDDDLRKLCLEMANVKPYALKECRIMKHLNGPVDADGKYASKGYGFVSFTKHESALTCLRRMNNNPSVFDKNNRPIVAFSIEDRAVMNARKKRLEKSKIKNPLHKRYVKNDARENGIDKNNKKEYKNNKKQFESNRKQIKNKPNQRIVSDVDENFVGETGRPGKMIKMRNRHKLNMQASIHKENAKIEKRKQKTSQRSKSAAAAKEKIKQTRQKRNTSENKKAKKSAEARNDRSFTDMVSKYKSKLIGASKDHEIKSKWYEQG